MHLFFQYPLCDFEYDQQKKKNKNKNKTPVIALINIQPN